MKKFTMIFVLSFAVIAHHYVQPTDSIVAFESHTPQQHIKRLRHEIRDITRAIHQTVVDRELLQQHRDLLIYELQNLQLIKKG